MAGYAAGRATRRRGWAWRYPYPYPKPYPYPYPNPNPNQVTEANWPVLAGLLGARLQPFEWPVVSPAARAVAATQAAGAD